jgi:protein-S-isoprenylcysteine O-methyltransferase Ste14
MLTYAFAVLVAGWLVWMLPFFLIKRGGSAQKIDRRARWGILLEAAGYSLVWQTQFWTRTMTPWRLGAGVVFLSLAGILSWTSARTLGRQWRIDAGLNADHQLVTAGAYRIVRHPIYTSMLCTLLGTGVMLSSPAFVVLGTVLFMMGTEIRVRIEDALLESRFGDEFRVYKGRVAAYIPFML